MDNKRLLAWSATLVGAALFVAGMVIGVAFPDQRLAAFILMIIGMAATGIGGGMLEK